MLNNSSIIASLLFGAIGFISFWYGKKMSLWKPISLGLALMIYPYFCPNAFFTWGIGILLAILLYFHHDE